MESETSNVEFYGKQLRENQLKAQMRTRTLLCWLFGASAIALGVLACMQHSLVRGTLHSLEMAEKDKDSLALEFFNASNRFETVLTETTNRYESTIIEMTNACEQAKVKEVNHWKRETEKMHGAVVIVERREKKLAQENVQLKTDYDEVKQDNDKLNAYLKTFKELTKTKLVELDKKNIETQIEMRKYKNNYETLVKLLQDSVRKKQQEANKADK